MFISAKEYFEALEEFTTEIKIIHGEKKFDAIIAPKRSGLFVGVILSHALHLTLFTPTEFKLQMNNLPFNNLLVCDTAVFKGRTFRKIKTKLAPRKAFTCAIWQERYGDADYYLYAPKRIIRFWYEKYST